jgi:multidrug efflux pump subunit AcrB
MALSPKEFEDIPLFSDGRKIVRLRDVAEVIDGTRWRTNVVRVDGRKAVYMPLLRQAGASAVRVIDRVQDFLTELHHRGTIPDDVEVEVAFDQSQYVRDSLDNLRTEALLGAALAALMVLLFLGSLRSTWIVALSIPLSVLAALVGLYYMGATLNIMTLGGLALVLGRIVDDSIVDVENTARHLAMGKTPFQAALDSAREVSVPILMATVTTTIVFVPLTFMTGMGKYLFTPLALSVVLALAASYVVSRTVSPLCCSRFLRVPRAGEDRSDERCPTWIPVVGVLAALLGLAAWLVWQFVPLRLSEMAPATRRWVVTGYHGLIVVGLAGAALLAIAVVFWVSPAFHRFFRFLTRAYQRLLIGCLRWRWTVLAIIVALVIPAALVLRHIGQELFPEVDSSEFTVHVRVAGGPRVEETERQVEQIESVIREVVPPDDLALLLGNVGISSRWSAIYTTNNGPHSAFIRVQLRSGFAGRTTPTLTYVERLRERLRERFPTCGFYFETGGMIRRILNAGALAPIEVQVIGRDNEQRRRVAGQLNRLISDLPGVEDTYLPQGIDLPQFRIRVDRARATQLGLSEGDVVRNVITALMSSAQIAPNFWIDPSTGNPYLISVQYPEYAVTGLQTLEEIPITAGGAPGKGAPVCRLRDVATVEREQGPIEVYHHAVDRVSQLFVNVADNDLAGVAAEVQKIVHGLKLPRGIRVHMRGEIHAMRESFREVAFSLCFAVALVYLLLAAQFASWVDPLIMLVAAPLGLIGVSFTLWATGTSLNIQSCMGVLMMIGISVSNSVLLVEFANRLRATGLATREAIVKAAVTRLRPILMTSLATIVSLLPMAIHLRPGDEMNLPLARAVIGGLAGSTVLTLLAVPVLYILLKPRGPAAPDAGDVPRGES